jgi:transcriptional regulator with XRE-family HTH domain
MKDKKISIEFLANKIGMTRSGLYSNFQNENMTVETLENICAVLGVHTSLFLDNPSASSFNIQINDSGDNHISLSECEKENKHLRELLEMKDKIISLLENK